MDIGRRSFLTSTLGLAALAATPATIKAAAASPPRVLLFDAFPIFDPRSIAGRVKEMFPAEGDALLELWRAKQFEYTWLRNSVGQYRDFWSVIRDALKFAARVRKLTLTAAQEDQLMGSYLALKAWPDVSGALHALKAAGVRLAFLSNFTQEMLRTNIHGVGLDGLFDQVLSTDQAGAFKPDPRAYRLGLDAFQLPKQEMLFAAFAGWDAAGAKAFGYPTFWVNRLAQPAEELGVTPDASGPGLTELISFMNTRYAVL